LAISGTSEFRDYAIEFTTRQFQISLWLAVITNASFGLWDLFGQDGASNESLAPIRDNHAYHHGNQTVFTQMIHSETRGCPLTDG
jgi:hypothetical protein